MGKLTDVLPTAIDAIVSDIEANVTLGAHETWKYADPKVVLPERCPLLACWLGPSRWQLIATPATFVLRPRVFVAWYVSRSKGEETGGAGDDTQLSAELAKADAIAVRLESMADGIPTTSRMYAMLQETRVETGEGSVLKLAHELEVEWL